MVGYGADVDESGPLAPSLRTDDDSSQCGHYSTATQSGGTSSRDEEVLVPEQMVSWESFRSRFSDDDALMSTLRAGNTAQNARVQTWETTQEEVLAVGDWVSPEDVSDSQGLSLDLDQILQHLGNEPENLTDEEHLTEVEQAFIRKETHMDG